MKTLNSVADVERKEIIMFTTFRPDKPPESFSETRRNLERAGIRVEVVVTAKEWDEYGAGCSAEYKFRELEELESESKSRIPAIGSIISTMIMMGSESIYGYMNADIRISSSVAKQLAQIIRQVPNACYHRRDIDDQGRTIGAYEHGVDIFTLDDEGLDCVSKRLEVLNKYLIGYPGWDYALSLVYGKGMHYISNLGIIHKVHESGYGVEWTKAIVMLVDDIRSLYPYGRSKNHTLKIASILSSKNGLAAKIAFYVFVVPRIRQSGWPIGRKPYIRYF